MYSAGCEAGITGSGFPHSDIPGSKPACGSPRLIAACHVLHRLLAPRHPPYALSSLTIKLTQHVAGPEPRFLGTKGQKRMSSKLAFPQIALLEQNLQIAHHVLHSCECPARYAMPAYSVVKEPCVRPGRTAPLLAGRSLAFYFEGGETIKNPASSAGPSRPNISGRVRAKLDCFLS